MKLFADLLRRFFRAPTPRLEPVDPRKRDRKRWRTHYCRLEGRRIAIRAAFCPICGARTRGFTSRTRRLHHMVIS